MVGARGRLKLPGPCWYRVVGGDYTDGYRRHLVANQEDDLGISRANILPIGAIEPVSVSIISLVSWETPYMYLDF